MLIVVGVAASTVLRLTPSASNAAAAQVGWQPGPSLQLARASFPLVALPSGDLLAAGGLTAAGIQGTVTAERLDVHAPVLGWRPVAPMSSGHRYSHHGRLLDSGEVLVVGEEHFLVGPPIADLFRIGTLTWRRSGNNPLTSRFAANLTLLADGRVLYAGGYGGGEHSDTYASAELYDPVTRQWSGTGAMSEARLGHGATRLAVGPHAGHVLVAGGSVRALDNALATCEGYDPAADSWHPLAPMHVSRWIFTLTALPDGRVLAAGGIGDPSRQELTSRADVEIYDPRTDRWSMAAPMTTARARHTSTLLSDGRVVVAGGSVDRAGRPTASVEVYDPSADRWSPAPELQTARLDHGAALLPSGDIIVVGGLSFEREVLASTEILAPAAIGPAVAAPTPAAAPTAGLPSHVCPQIAGRVPMAAIQAALAAPAAVGGFGKPVHPGRAVGPYNPLRTWLSLDVLAQPYHPLGNRLVYKAGCP